MAGEYNADDMPHTTRRALALLLLLAVVASSAAGCAKKVVVPDVSKLSLSKANGVLTAKGLKAEVRGRLPNEGVPKDGVLSQDPPAGTEVSPGTLVGLTMSTGPQGITLPDLRNQSVDKAKAALQLLGLRFKIIKVIDPSNRGLVLNQTPPPDTSVVSDQEIQLTVAFSVDTTPLPDVTPGTTPTPGPSKPKTKPKPSVPSTSSRPHKSTGLTVAIDPGHQARGDSSLEPVGPGSSTQKAKVSDGTSGVSTHKAESQLNLEVSLKLRSVLEAKGVKVVMIRTKQGVNVSNIRRAEIANNVHADLFIRIHADGVGNSSASGVKTLVPTKNQWTGPIYSASRRAAEKVQPLLVRATGFPDAGIQERGDLTAFNWSKVPTFLVEMGFMSNPSEDRAMSDPAVQSKIAQAIADGSMTYLRSK